MAIPKYYEMYHAFLSCLSDGMVHTNKDIREYVIKEFGITDGEAAELLPSGKQRILDNRIGWCRAYLKKAELIESPARAQFFITEKGKALLQKTVVIDDDVLMQYQSFYSFKKGTKARTRSVSAVNESETPQETLDRVYSEVNAQLADDLYTFIMSQTPDFFEALVIRLLESMGYGGTIQGAGMVTQSSRDEGIDGIINEDKLGFDQIYIQAKRWETDKTVGRPEIQKFVGALAGQGATKGVFITTAHFSSAAVEYAQKQHTTKVILIDGKRLTDLMIEHELGVTTEYTYKIRKIDTDFFSEE